MKSTKYFGSLMISAASSPNSFSKVFTLAKCYKTFSSVIAEQA
jgi:hypothetical protein